MPIKVLIDTNVWISAFLNPAGYPAKIVGAWLEDKIEIIVSIPLLKEISDVLQRPRIQRKYKYSNEEIAKYPCCPHIIVDQTSWVMYRDVRVSTI